MWNGLVWLKIGFSRILHDSQLQEYMKSATTEPSQICYKTNRHLQMWVDWTDKIYMK
jgi:hypothetical protein